MNITVIDTKTSEDPYSVLLVDGWDFYYACTPFRFPVYMPRLHAFQTEIRLSVLHIDNYYEDFFLYSQIALAEHDLVVCPHLYLTNLCFKKNS